MSNFKFTTGISMGEAHLRSMDLVDVIKSSNIVIDVERHTDLDATMPGEIDDPYPVIVLINGSGGCGKGTMIKFIRRFSERPVYELSTVDPLRPVARELMRYQQDLFSDMFKVKPMDASTEEEQKGGPYRQFLSDLKYAWSKHNDGPNWYTVGTALKVITNNTWTIDEKTGLPIQPEPGSTTYAEDGGIDLTLGKTYDMPAIIFINAREPKNLDELKKAFWELGLLCITMRMDGIEHEAKDLADSDLLVNDYEYDLTVKNKGTIDDLSVLAFSLNTLINRANHMYGVSVFANKKDPLEKLGREAIYILDMNIGLSDIDDNEIPAVKMDSGKRSDEFNQMSIMEQFHTLMDADSYGLQICTALLMKQLGYAVVDDNGVGRIINTKDGSHALTTVEQLFLVRKIVKDIIHGEITDDEDNNVMMANGQAVLHYIHECLDELPLLGGASIPNDPKFSKLTLNEQLGYVESFSFANICLYKTIEDLLQERKIFIHYPTDDKKTVALCRIILTDTTDTMEVLTIEEIYDFAKNLVSNVYWSTHIDTVPPSSPLFHEDA